jgi:hypothetical protein
VKKSSLLNWFEISLLALWFSCLVQPLSAIEPVSTSNGIEIGSFDQQGKLHNSAEQAMKKLTIGSFGAYFFKEQDLNIGISIGRPTKRRTKWTLDIAPHHIGPGVSWAPNRGRYRWLYYLGLGVGADLTYNTQLDCLELGVKGTLIRW